MTLSFIKSSGNIITEDFCIALANETKSSYVKDQSFGSDIRKVDEVIASSFDKLRERWEEHRSLLLKDELDTTTLRKNWIIPFLKSLGYEPEFISHNIKSSSGVEYQLAYKGWNASDAPIIHMVHSSQDFDTKDKNSRTHSHKSPHDCLQQYLNTSDNQWAILINGKKVRLLRDFYHSMTKGFLEFDLEGIFETASSEQFRILYRILHRSRMAGQKNDFKEEYDGEGNPLEKGEDCLLEVFHKKSRETGVKVGNRLREQVLEAIEKLGNGFAENINPEDLQNGKVKIFYGEILNIIYRLLFLSFAEQKGWLPVRNSIYARTYSLGALREIAEKGNYLFDEERDLWEGLKLTFHLVANGYTFSNGDKINAFGGQLFSDRKIYTIANLPLKNKFLLHAIHNLSYFWDKETKTQNRINYATLAIDELGSVYESLLDYEPKVAQFDVEHRSRKIKRGEFYLDDKGTDRKTTGSYYTDSRLVAQLIESTLVPIIDNALKGKTSQTEKENAILELKVADIACGSGAFICAALEKLGERLAHIRMGEEERPTDEQLREAKRDVLLSCIYGVDINPMAIELAKFSLWITASMPDMPLTFLDHKLKCGNSLLGATPELIKKGIPVEAYNESGNDDKDTSKWLRNRIKKELEQIVKDNSVQGTFDLRVSLAENNDDAKAYLELLRHEQDTLEDIAEVEEEFYELQKHLRKGVDWRLADTWTAAFFMQKSTLNKPYPTNETLYSLKNGLPIDSDLVDEVERIAKSNRFFHFHLEFPEVFKTGGFSCLLGNPPWEKITLEDELYFENKILEISKSKNKSERKKLISKIQLTHPEIYHDYLKERHTHDATSNYFRNSSSYPLTGVSRINLYSVFTERFYQLKSPAGCAGIIVPPGIIAEDNNKKLFNELFSKNNIISFVDFENRKGFFRDVHKEYRFALFTLGHNRDRAKFYFFLTDIEQIYCQEKEIDLNIEELKCLNPNTLTFPIIKSRADFKLLFKIHCENNIIQNERASDFSGWKIILKTPFNMSNDSGMFVTNPKEMDNYVPLYESKMIFQYDHRYASINENGELNVHLSKDKKDIYFTNKPYYYISKNDLGSRFGMRQWFLVYRMITNVNNSRTLICAIIPKAACGHSLSIVECESLEAELLLLANLNTFVLDYVCRLKMNGRNLNHWIFKQLPIISKEAYPKEIRRLIIEKCFKLIYTSDAMRHIALEHGYSGKPFIWDDSERFKLQCELDVIFARLYSISKTDLEYILDSFYTLRRREEEKFGCFRTKHEILSIYDDFSWMGDRANHECNLVSIS